MIAALFVERDGPYWGLPAVEPWDRSRDARRYGGPHAVVAHPPCARWGRFFGGSPETFPRLKMGDDGGCFLAALHAVRMYGGVIEHPADSYAWAVYGLARPDSRGGWMLCDEFGGFTCQIEQGHYGGLARKPTWLYANHLALYPELLWGASAVASRELPKDATPEERRKAQRAGNLQRLSKLQRARTPLPFRDLLINIAQSVSTVRFGRVA